VGKNSRRERCVHSGLRSVRANLRRKNFPILEVAVQPANHQDLLKIAGGNCGARRTCRDARGWAQDRRGRLPASARDHGFRFSRKPFRPWLAHSRTILCPQRSARLRWRRGACASRDAITQGRVSSAVPYFRLRCKTAASSPLFTCSASCDHSTRRGISECCFLALDHFGLRPPNHHKFARAPSAALGMLAGCDPLLNTNLHDPARSANVEKSSFAPKSPSPRDPSP